MAGDEDSLNKVTDDVAKLAEEQRRSAEEAAKMQDEALERASHSTRTEVPEMSQAVGGQ